MMTLTRLVAAAALLSATAAMAQTPAPLQIGGLSLLRAAPLGLVEPNIMGGLLVTTLGAVPELPGLGSLPPLLPRLDAFQPLPLDTQPLSDLADILAAPLAP